MSNGSEPLPVSSRRRKAWRIAVALLLVVGCVAAGVYVFRCWPARDPEQTFEAARVALKSGDLGRVQQAAQALDGIPEYAPHCHYLRGVLLLKQGNPRAALQEFHAAGGVPELEVDVLVSCGEAFYQLDRAAESVRFWRAALSRNPSAVNAHRWLGVFFYDIGAMDQAVDHLSVVAKLDSGDARPHRLMGLIYKDYENYRAALDCYQESLRRDPYQVAVDQVRLELAECQVKLSDYPSALTTLRRCPASAECLVLQAKCHLGLGDAAQAASLTEQALQKSPDNFAAMLLQGKMLAESGDPQKAVEVLLRAVAAHPKDEGAYLPLAQAYRRLGDRPQAEKYQKQSEELAARWKKVYSLHEQALRDPGNVDLRYQLGELLQQLDRPELAETWFHAARLIGAKRVDVGPPSSRKN